MENVGLIEDIAIAYLLMLQLLVYSCRGQH